MPLQVTKFSILKKLLTLTKTFIYNRLILSLYDEAFPNSLYYLNFTVLIKYRVGDCDPDRFIIISRSLQTHKIIFIPYNLNKNHD